jgi:predicted double-glycine peptidase
MRHFITILVAVCGAATCAFVGRSTAADVTSRGPVRSLLELRQERVVVQQWDISCAAAALATVLTYGFNDPVSERTVATGMLRHTAVERVNRRGGFSLLDLKRFAESRGYTARAYRNLTMDNLVKFENAIIPIDAHGYNHFVVYRRIRNGRVEFADPAFGNRTMKRESFQKAWIGGIAFVLRAPTQRIGADGDH